MAFKDTPIKRKLTALFLVTSGAVCLLTCAAYFTFEYLTFRQSILGQLGTLGEVIAANSTARWPLAMSGRRRNPRRAQSGAAHHGRRPLRPRGQAVFAISRRSATRRLPTAPEPDVTVRPFICRRFSAGCAGQQTAGTLYLKSDLGAMYERFRLYGAIVVGVAVASLLLRVLGINHAPAADFGTDPDAGLHRPRLADRGDYSVRATKSADDEVGLLTDAFNQMLTRIDEQGRVVRESEERLNLALMSSGIGTWSWNVVENSMILGRLHSSSVRSRAEDLFGAARRRPPSDTSRRLSSRGGRHRRDPGKDAPYDTDYRVIWPDGTMRCLPRAKGPS